MKSQNIRNIDFYYQKPNLPDFDKLRKSPFDINDTPEKRRAHLIKEGISPPVTFEYKPINFSTSGILDSFYQSVRVKLNSFVFRRNIWSICSTRGRRKSIYLYKTSICLFSTSIFSFLLSCNSLLYSRDSKFAGKAVEQVSKTLTKKFKHARLVRKHDESFDESSFAQSAQQIYIDAHQALAE